MGWEFHPNLFRMSFITRTGGERGHQAGFSHASLEELVSPLSLVKAFLWIFLIFLAIASFLNERHVIFFRAHLHFIMLYSCPVAVAGGVKTTLKHDCLHLVPVPVWRLACHWLFFVRGGSHLKPSCGVKNNIFRCWQQLEPIEKCKTCFLGIRE